MEDDSNFDPYAALAELRRIAPAGVGRKVPFVRQCAAYAALWNGVKPSVVAETFGLSRASISAIAGCRNDNRTETIMTVGDYSETFPDPSITKRASPSRKLRYQDVAHEFIRLGEREFLRIYYTKAINAELLNNARQMGLTA